MTPELSIHIKIHGFLLWASLGFLMPLGVVIIRMSESAKSIKMVKVLFYTHVTVQVSKLQFVLATNCDYSGFQVFNTKGMKTRSLWYLVHWLLGTGVCVLGIANIFIGLHTFHEKTSSIVSLWAVLFTAEVSFMAFLYLLQSRWEYVMKQGVTQDEQIRPADHASPTRNQKEMVVLP
ncbi:hypothetical protein ZIOFF_042287 [Zingiber officinale]|uniref:Cytochrome b561 domain-containing protein n=1 Tax=Zingiber officinale TaxID=94328 RepID=A0A8J5G7S1_ZINOF|nr:hypothetical protein ZIOFF_042287 [Zingiber officinale]